MAGGADLPQQAIVADWLVLPPADAAQPSLRCWWARPTRAVPVAGVVVLPEVFGVNGWVRSVADRLAGHGYAALAVPLFARTAPDLSLGYDAAALQEGRSHKERTTASQLLEDIGRGADWLAGQLVSLSGSPEGGPSPRLGCVGFCFGGHAALLAATLPQFGATCDFYGAGVVSGRPGGGPPSLAEVPAIRGRLLCVVGSEDPLIPASDVAAIGAALEAVQPGESGRHRLLVLPGGHGFMCEARADHRAESAAAGWQAMLTLFAERL
ncbi:MAG: dienelactone hydrolase family protein [Cyanobacteriota bacterium]|jgi:carboxymethylenebutenolidase